MQIAQRGAVRHAGIDHKAEVVRLKLYGLCLTIVIQVKLCDGDFVSLGEIDVFHNTVLFKYNALFSQIFFDRADNTVVLVKRTPRNAFQCLDAAELKYHSVHVTAEFEYAAPCLECKCRLPHMPEIRGKEMGHVIKPLLDCHVIQFLLVGAQKL